MSDIRENLAKRLIALRKEKKLTQLELAQKLNYSDKSISKWEHGDALPDIEVIAELAKFYNVSIDFLVNNDAPREKANLNKKKTHILVTLLSFFCVYLVATALFVTLKLSLNQIFWTIFLWAIPASTIVLIVFNAIWGKHRFSITLNSILCWSVIAVVYIQFLSANLWPLFLVGAPLEVGIVLFALLKR